MKLTVVGCTGSVPGPQSPASSYLVEAPYEGRTFALLVDCGPGAFGALHRYIEPALVDAFALSHLHPDHCLDLCACYVAGCYSPSAPWPTRPVYGPTGTAARLANAYEVPDPDPAVAQSASGILDHFDYRDWQPSQRIGPFIVRTALVDHPVAAYAIRIEEDIEGGGTMVYSGDTGPCDALVELARGVDLLLVEAAFMSEGSNRPHLHLTGEQAAAAGQAAGVGSVVLTHIPPWHDPERVRAAAVPHFDGPVGLASSGATWQIGSGK